MVPEKIFVKLINKQFLSEIIGETVGEYSVYTGSKQGDNVAGSLLAVDIRSGDRKNIYHIVIKTPPYDAPGQYTYVKNWKVFELENRFYKFLVPELEQLYKRKNQNAPTGPTKMDDSLNIPVPRYFMGDQEFLALEDVRPQGYKMADKYQGLTFPEVSLVMKCLGKLHASTYAYIKENGERIFDDEENLVFKNYLVHNHYMPEHNEMSEATFNTVYIKGIELLSRRNSVLGAKLLKYAPEPHKRMLAFQKATDVEHFAVISHGDIWVNNLIFRYEPALVNGENSEVPVDCMILDFQQTRRESIFWDLLYFMYTSTTPEFRKDFLIPSLMVYHDSFMEVVGKFKTPAPIGFTRGWLVDEFFKNIPNVFAYMPFAIALQLGDFTVLGHKSPAPIPVDAKPKEEPWDVFYANMVELCVTLLEHSPIAMNRLEAVALELDAQRVFDG